MAEIGAPAAEATAVGPSLKSADAALFPETEKTPDTQEERHIAARLASPDNDNNSPPSSSISVEKTILNFEDGDLGNPHNWSHTYRSWVVFLGVLSVLNSTLGSALPSGDSPQLAAHFNVTVAEQLVLPNSIYICGYVLGPLLFGPLSEKYGRQWVMLGTFFGFTVFTLAICFSPNWAAFNIFRLLKGIFAAAPISVTGGIYADLYDNPVHRGRAMAMFMTGTTWGPQISPFVSGYLAVYGWRYPFWFGLALAGASWIPMVFLPETFAPTILQRRARKIRKQDPGARVFAKIDLEQTGIKNLVFVILARPFKMFFQEALVFNSCLFLSFIYGLLYLYYQAYPLIFVPVYGFSLGEEGLTFLAIGVGSLVACPIYLWYDYYLAKAKARKAPWSQQEEYRRLPLACFAGPVFSISMFWLGWTARADIPWIVPTLSGLPFGCGFLLLFMSLLNYLVDAYTVYAASALAAASCSRSIFGTVLPFAAKPMFDALGIAWACSLLGFLSLAMSVIPFVFIKYGDRIRTGSKFCNELAELQALADKDKADSGRHASSATGDDAEKSEKV